MSEDIPLRKQPIIFDIGFDLDNVLFPYAENITEHFRNAGYEGITETTTWKYWSDQWGMSDQTHSTEVKKAINSGFFLRGDPPAGMVSLMSDLVHQGHRLHIITARELLAIPSTHMWVKEKFPGIPFHSVVVSEDKSIIETDLFIDDKIETLQMLSEFTNTVPVCYDRPWNQQWTGPRAHNASDFSYIIEEYSKMIRGFVYGEEDGDGNER